MRIKHSHRKFTMIHIQTSCANRITGKKGARLAELGTLAPVFEKSATELKQKLLKCKSTIQRAAFNVGTLIRIGQRPVLTASENDYNRDIVCIQEHTYLHSKEMKYHDTSKGWTFISVSTWKNSVNAAIGSVGMRIRLRALKSLNSIEKLQPRMMVVMFNGNPSTTIICHSPTNVSDETDHIAFYNELSSLVGSIPEHNFLVIGGDMNAQIDKNANNKFGLQN